MPDDDDKITCWCGATGTFEELFNQSGIGPTCYGTGTLQCRCGGDQCFCHHHGEIDCDGCEDCEGEGPDDLSYYDEDNQPDWISDE